MNDFDFGNFICELRTEKGMSQSELGKLLGVSNKAVSKWEMGVAKPRPDKLSKLSEIFGVTVEELLCGKRSVKPNGDEEISFAIDMLIREYKRTKTAFIVSTVIFFAAPLLTLLTMLIAYMSGNIDSTWALIPIAVCAILHLLGEVGVIVFLILTVKRKRMIYASFPNRREEVSARSHTVPPAKKTGRLGAILICGVFLMLIVAMYTLYSLGIISANTAFIVIYSSCLGVAIANVVFTRVWINAVCKNIAAQNYEKAIEKGKFMLEVWLPDGRGTIPDTLRLNIAVAYFSLYDDENFRDYLEEITSRGFTIAKSYWKCLDAIAHDDKSLFRTEYNTVFLPLAEKATKKIAKIAAFYGEPLRLFAALLNESNSDEIKAQLKAQLYAVITNPRTRSIIDKL